MHDFHEQFNFNCVPCDGVFVVIFFKTIERLSITFTSNGKREFLPRDQVSSLIVVCCLLFLQLNFDIYTLDSFYHLRPQIARARGGGRRGKATAVINIKSKEAGTIILQSKLNNLCG